MKENTDVNKYAMAGYIVGNTLTENGSVKRGVCEQENGYLTRLIESSVGKDNDKIIATPLEGGESFEVTDDTLVSMNMFAFTPKLFGYLEEGLIKFLKQNQNNLETCEYLIPSVVFELIKDNQIQVEVLKTNAIWHGITYKEDKEELVNSINKLIEEGKYPKNLWVK